MGFAQAYPDDIPTGSTIFEAHGIDPAMWEPQELGTQIYFQNKTERLNTTILLFAIKHFELLTTFV